MQARFGADPGFSAEAANGRSHKTWQQIAGLAAGEERDERLGFGDTHSHHFRFEQVAMVPGRGAPAIELRFRVREVDADVFDADAGVGAVEPAAEAIVAQTTMLGHLRGVLGRDGAEIGDQFERAQSFVRAVFVDQPHQMPRVRTGLPFCMGVRRRMT